jgi:cell division protein FtsL
MAQRTTVNRRTTTYRAEVQGNVVRQFQTVPNHPEKVNGPVEVPRRSRKAERSTLSIPYCIFLAVACVLTLSLGAYYLEQQALATSSQKKIASLESELAELKKVNADDLNRIETSINLEEIREIAINELGMVYATKENVILYKNTNQNYVSQYGEVPQEADSFVKSIIKSK